MIAFGVSTASAQLSIHGSGSASVGYNDNISNAPSDPVPGAPVRVGDAFIGVSPGLMLMYQGPRASFVANYQRPATFFVRNPGTEVSADVASFISEFQLTENDTLNLGVNGSRSTSRAITLGQPQDTQLTAVTATPISFITFGVGEQWSHVISERWSLVQAATFTGLVPIDSIQAERGDAGLSVSAFYRWDQSAISLNAGGTAAYIPGTADTTADPLLQLDRSPIIVSATVGYVQDLSPTWSINTNVGGVVAHDPSVDDTYLGGLWGAGINMVIEDYQAALLYQRTVAPTLLTGITTLSDTVTLNGPVPITRKPAFAALGTVGFSANQQISIDDSVSSPFKTFVADVGLGWLDPRYPNVIVRYTRSQQFDVEPGAEANVAIGNFSANQVMATVAWTLPTLAQPPTIGQRPTRADAGDPKE